MLTVAVVGLVGTLMWSLGILNQSHSPSIENTSLPRKTNDTESNILHNLSAPRSDAASAVNEATVLKSLQTNP